MDEIGSDAFDMFIEFSSGENREKNEVRTFRKCYLRNKKEKNGLEVSNRILVKMKKLSLKCTSKSIRLMFKIWIYIAKIGKKFKSNDRNWKIKFFLLEEILYSYSGFEKTF